MTALANPGIFTVTSAYRTTNAVIPNSFSTNGYVDGTVGTALGSVAPTVPVFDGKTIAAFIETKDTTTLKFSLNLIVLGTVEQEAVFDKIAFEFADAQYNLYQSDAVFSTALIAGYSVWTWALPATLFGVVAQIVAVTIEDLTDDFNCDCIAGLSGQSAVQFGLDTLVNLRGRMMIRLGYAAQAANPPPGMAAFCNEYLIDAQKQLEKKFNAQNMLRYFRWTMQVGQRYYGIDKSEGGCLQYLDPTQISAVGIEDLNGAWYELTQGIPLVYYTRAKINSGWPTNFDIRQCIEVFPAPQAEYTLWIKGKFATQPFAADSDMTTLDAELIFLLALANAKGAKGQVDAGNVMAQATSYLGALVAGTHGTTRYVPRSKVQNPATPPRFLPLSP
jgi:hypothetical protein